MGSEGAAAAVNDVRQRGLCTDDCVFIPRASSTMIAPTARLCMLPSEDLLFRWGNRGSAKVKLLERFDARGFPQGALLAEPQPLEILDFQGGLEMEQHRTLEFR